MTREYKVSKRRQLLERSKRWRPPEDDPADMAEITGIEPEPPKRKALPRDMKRAMNGKDLPGLLWALAEKDLKNKMNGEELLLGEDNLVKVLTEIRRLEELKSQGQRGDEVALLDWINNIVEHSDGEPIQTGWSRGSIFE